MAVSHADLNRRWSSRISVAVSTALVSCGIVGLVLAGFSSAGIPLDSPMPGLGLAAILGSMKEKVYTLGIDVLKWFWKGRINFVMSDDKKNDDQK